MLPPIWMFYLVLLALALAKRDGIFLRVVAALSLDWLAGWGIYQLTKEQFNPLVNGAIDYFFFGVVVAENAIGWLKRTTARMMGDPVPAIRVQLNAMQITVASGFLFLCVCHTVAAILQADGRFDTSAVYRYWNQMHNATWAQMWVVAFYGSGGGNVLRRVGGSVRNRWRHSGHAMAAAALPLLLGRTGGGVSGASILGGGIDRDVGRSSVSVGWDHRLSAFVGGAVDPRFGRDHLLATAHHLGLDQADDIYGGREWERPSLNRLFSDGSGGSRASEWKSTAINGNDVGTQGGYDAVGALPGRKPVIRDRFMGARATLLAAFRVPAASERNKAVDFVVEQAKKVEEAATFVQSLIQPAPAASLDDVMKRIAEDM